jgi:hypothetical protein
MTGNRLRQSMRKVWRIITFPIRVVLWPFAMIWRWVASVVGNTAALLREDAEDVPIGDTFVKAIGQPSLLLPHIAALRFHLFRSVIALTIATAFAFFYAERILAYLAEPIGGIASLEAIRVTESLTVFMRVSLLSGFALSSPCTTSLWKSSSLFHRVSRRMSAGSAAWRCRS